MDELGRMDTPAHRLDARAKIAATAVFIVAVMSFPRYEISALMIFFLYPVALAALGRVPFFFIFRKMLVAAPFALLVGIFNPFFDRAAVLAIGGVEVSGGWLSSLSIMLRFVLTVGTALVLVACTGMHRLCAGLEKMGLPDIFAAQLLFLYRYLFVIANEGARMLRSLELRGAGVKALKPAVYGPLAGHLLLRSMARAERIYRSMAARGFSGQIRVLRKSAFQPADWVFLLGWTAFFAAARAFNLAHWIGGLFI